MMPRLLTAVLFLAVFFAAQATVAQDVNLDKSRSRVHEMTGIKLRGDPRRDFRNFRRKGDYFGAFYVNVSEKLSGSYWNASNLTAAERFARRSCEIKSQYPERCVLYARIVPKRYDPSDAGPRLSREGNKEFREYRRLQDEDRHGAFAIADNGASGYSWAEASPEWADREALKRCIKSYRKRVQQVPEPLQSSLPESGEFECRVVHRTP